MAPSRDDERDDATTSAMLRSDTALSPSFCSPYHTKTKVLTSWQSAEKVKWSSSPHREGSVGNKAGSKESRCFVAIQEGSSQFGATALSQAPAGILHPFSDLFSTASRSFKRT